MIQNHPNQDVNLPFHNAIYGGKPLVAISLLKQSKSIDINSHGVFTGTALHWIASQAGSRPSEDDKSKGIKSLIPQMVELGADPNSTSSIGTTPLHWAVVWNNFEAVEELVKYDIDVNAKDIDGITPLHLCMMGYAFELTLTTRFTSNAEFYVELLKCKKNVIPHLEDAPCKSAEVLLKHGAEINPIDSFNLTPLDWVYKLYERPSKKYKNALRILISCLESHGGKTFEDLQHHSL